MTKKSIAWAFVYGVLGATLVVGCSSSSGAGGQRDGGPGMDASMSEAGGGGGDGGGVLADGGVRDGGGALQDSGVIVVPDGGFADGGVVFLPDGGICHLKACLGKVYQCGNCKDDDGDGLIDDQDPDCLGPCDNNEAGFDLQIPGNPLSGCNRDCYFDNDSGSGNDGCSYALQCDPATPISGCCDPTVNDPTESGLATCGANKNIMSCSDSAAQSQMCLNVCMPIVPNGCDCFGCCDIRTTADPTDPHWVYIGTYSSSQSGSKVGTCTLTQAQAGNDTACRPCNPDPQCLNTCGRCELCLGKTAADLPPDCFPNYVPPDAGVPADGGAPADGGVPADGGAQCPAGVQPCGLPGESPCPNNYFCLTGCCITLG